MTIFQRGRDAVRNVLKWMFRPILRPLRDQFLSPAIHQFLKVNAHVEYSLHELHTLVKISDETILGLTLAQNLPPRGSTRLRGYPKKIYVDVRCLQMPAYNYRGIGYHSAGVLRHAKEFLGDSIRLIGLTDSLYPVVPEEFSHLCDEYRDRVPLDVGPALVLHLSPMTHCCSFLAQMFLQPELFHVAIFYDTIPLQEPHRYLPTPRRHREYLNSMIWLKMVDCFCAISKTAATQLENIIGPASDRMAVTGACLRESFQDIDFSMPLPGPFASRKYFLVIGSEDERKNVEIVLASHARCEVSIGLIIAGHHSPERLCELQDRYTEAGGHLKNLYFAQSTSDGQMAMLYHHALVTVVPSRAEGFSLPIIEALYCDCPVILSDISAHRELVEFEDALFQFDDGVTLTSLFNRFLNESPLRGEWLAIQKQKSLVFDENAVARKVWEHVGSFLPAR
ncbi:glycosyltransferase [Telmatocola sphagniphila]|uniref:Glycosyltransferase n=1 Tax=Telmatocola sphagniphila TaxID=1123043 RepID=A0A8E6B8T0_9BACT|nr:glycosyltransferase [Telmatocola sphagniphila]QVL32628.1 glycosyltransferase [Telmatocola sphagniphila]